MSDSEEKKRVGELDPEDEEDEEESDDEEEGSGEDEGESDSEFDDPPDYVDDITDEGRDMWTHAYNKSLSVFSLGGADKQGTIKMLVIIVIGIWCLMQEYGGGGWKLYQFLVILAHGHAHTCTHIHKQH